jgi:uncharacterized protein (TIGR02594 family)
MNILIWKRTLLAGVIASSALITPALAKTSDHHARRHFGHAREAQARQHFRHAAGVRHVHRHRWAARLEHRRLASRYGAARGTAADSVGSSGTSSLVAEARRYIGGNPTGWAHDWCGRFMNLVLERTGHRGSGSNLALAFANYGRRVGPQVGAVAVMGRRGGGHVGVVSGVLPNGDVKVISGNHGHRVAESVYSRGRILAFVMPTT